MQCIQGGGADTNLSEMSGEKKQPGEPLPAGCEIFHATGRRVRAILSNTGHLRGHAVSDVAFSKMVIKLAADIRALDNQVGRVERDVICKKLNTARALSDVLWTKMGADGIDPLKYREILIDIEYGLENIQTSLDRQRSTVW